MCRMLRRVIRLTSLESEVILLNLEDKCFSISLNPNYAGTHFLWDELRLSHHKKFLTKGSGNLLLLVLNKTMVTTNLWIRSLTRRDAGSAAEVSVNRKRMCPGYDAPDAVNPKDRVHQVWQEWGKRSQAHAQGHSRAMLEPRSVTKEVIELIVEDFRTFQQHQCTWDVPFHCLKDRKTWVVGCLCFPALVPCSRSNDYWLWPFLWARHCAGPPGWGQQGPQELCWEGK